MDTQTFQFNDPDHWGPEFGSELAHGIKDYVERKLAPLRIAVAQLEAKNARLEGALESRSAFKYAGVYRDGRVYDENSFVTFDGSIWHCSQKTSTPPGNGSASWVLACKRGRDGKDGASK